jgi:hypothetical protein
MFLVPEAERDGFMLGGVADLETVLATAGLVTRATGFAFAGPGVTLLGAATGAAAGAFGFLSRRSAVTVELTSSNVLNVPINGDHRPDSSKTKKHDIKGGSAGLTGHHHRGDFPTLPSDLPTLQQF